MKQEGRKRREKRQDKERTKKEKMNERKNVSKKKENRISPEIPMIIILSLLYYYF